MKSIAICALAALCIALSSCVGLSTHEKIDRPLEATYAPLDSELGLNVSTNKPRMMRVLVYRCPDDRPMYRALPTHKIAMLSASLPTEKPGKYVCIVYVGRKIYAVTYYVLFDSQALIVGTSTP